MPDTESQQSQPSYIVTETRHQRLVRLGVASPIFLQGAYPFAGKGMFEIAPLHDELTYVVPKNKLAELLYVRGGNHSDDLIYLAVTVDSKPIRYFPVAPKSDFHVPLAIVETHPAATRFDVCISAPRGLTGTVIVDIGLIELDANA